MRSIGTIMQDKYFFCFFFLMIRRPPRSTQSRSSAASDVYKRQVPEDWWYFPVVARMHSERTGYPTQKPEALLERILLASSNPGSLVADFFCGSGTFPLAAARHGRRFLAGDVSWRAIHTTRERVIGCM